MAGRDVLGIITAISLGLTVWRWLAQRRFPLHRRGEPGRDLPGLTLLKPLKGRDPETSACLRSWLEQDYPAPMQILFGVASADDPACGAVRELLAEYPQADAQLVICGATLGANRKVSTLRQLEPLVKHPLLMIGDADTRAARDFAATMAALCGEGAGLVNCFYRLANPATLAMRWEAVAVNADFWTQVLQSASFKQIDFALGAVMTLPASELKAIGGFAALSDYLADDYQLGQRIAANGHRIVMAPMVVDCWEPQAGWGAVWRHQLRWTRTIRVCQPWPFFFSLLNNSSFWPLLLLGVSINRAAWGVAVGGAALVFRIATARQQLRRMTGARLHRDYWWLVPVKDLLDAALWAAAFWGNHIEWRGEPYRIAAGGKLERI